MRNNPAITTETIAESIVRKESGASSLDRLDADRVEAVKQRLSTIARAKGYDPSYLLGDSTVKVLDEYNDRYGVPLAI